MYPNREDFDNLTPVDIYPTLHSTALLYEMYTQISLPPALWNGPAASAILSSTSAAYQTNGYLPLMVAIAFYVGL